MKNVSRNAVNSALCEILAQSQQGLGPKQGLPISPEQLALLTNPDMRQDALVLFDCAHGNPNGDPALANMPRHFAASMRGLVSDVCVKRKLRNYVEMAYAGDPSMGVFISHADPTLERDDLVTRSAAVIAAAAATLPPPANPAKLSKVEQAHLDVAVRRTLASEFWDVRVFGVTAPSKEASVGIFAGSVQPTNAVSYDPIEPYRCQVGRVIQTDATRGSRQANAEAARKKIKGSKDAGEKVSQLEVEELAESMDVESSTDGTFGDKWMLEYALYRMPVHYSPMRSLATKVSLTSFDLGVFWEAMYHMFEHDRSTARGEMAHRRIVVFVHENGLGNAVSERLFERVKVARKPDVATPSGFGDYVVDIDFENLPQGVHAIVL